MFRPLSVFNRHRDAPALHNDATADPFSAFHSEINRLFDDFFGEFSAPAFSGDNGGNGARPVHIDFKDKGKSIELHAELPGVDEDDVEVELDDNLLTIRGEKKTEEDDEETGYSRRAWSSFQRSMSLPFDVDPDAIEASFKNGVLKLKLPKPPELENKSRRIEVRKG